MSAVTSAHNPRLKEAARLIASAHERRKNRRCVLEGEHLIEMYAARHGVPQTLIVTETHADAPLVRRLAARMPDPCVLRISDALFKTVSSLPPSVAMMAVVDLPSPASAHGDFCMLLEDVQDPGNVGALLRTAAAAGVTHCALSKHCAAAWAPKTLRAAQGAHFLLEIVENVDATEWCAAWSAVFRPRGGNVVGTVARDGQNLFTASLSRPLVLALGNEGAGLSEVLARLVDLRVTIPMPGGMESLNVAAAAAVVLFECVRQEAPKP